MLTTTFVGTILHSDLQLSENSSLFFTAAILAGKEDCRVECASFGRTALTIFNAMQDGCSSYLFVASQSIGRDKKVTMKIVSAIPHSSFDTSQSSTCFHSVMSGKLPQDPESRFTKEGKQMVVFSVVSNHDKEPTFMKCIAFESLANLILNYRSKGGEIIVAGTQQLNTWTDRDGNEQSKLEIIVQSVELIGRSGKDEAEGQSNPSEQRPKTLPSQSQLAGSDKQYNDLVF